MAGPLFSSQQELLGYAEMTPVKQYLSWYEQLVHDGIQDQTEQT